MNYSKDLEKPIFKTIQNVADELNYPTYVVGGWVRDLLLQRKQKKTKNVFCCAVVLDQFRLLFFNAVPYRVLP